jgi:hypothetical protein
MEKTCCKTLLSVDMTMNLDCVTDACRPQKTGRKEAKKQGGDE